MPSADSLGYVDLQHDIQTPEQVWKFTVDDLADYRGITTKLNRDIWLDWHDILSHPEEARMHMYPGAVTRPATLGIKRQRMLTWQKAIIILDGMMIDVKSPLPPNEVLSLLKVGKLPRPTNVALPTGNPSLVKLLGMLNADRKKNAPYELVMKWSSLVRYALEGAIVQPKKFLKGQELLLNDINR